jgi:hypothetical protein
MGIETGIARQIRFKRQGSKGTMATNTGGQVLRRTAAKFKLGKETYTTEAEMTATQQLTSNRHGVKLVDASVDGILSPGTYSDILSAILRRDFAAVANMTGLSLTIAGSANPYTVTRAAGSFLTDGVKIGMVARITAGSVNAANLNKNMFVTGVTATVLTVYLLPDVAALVAEGPIASCTIAIPGKVTYTPPSGHTNIYYTIEDWNPSVPFSERSQDVKFTNATLNLPGSGNATVQMSGSGLDQSNNASVYFASPTAETTSEACQAASGVLMVNGVAQAVVTDLSITIDGKPQPADGTVGGNLRADVFRGKVMVSGQFSAYFDSSTLHTLFTAETVTSLAMVLAAGSAAAADFVAITLPRIDLNDSDKDDPETGQKRVYQFVAEYNSAGGAGVSSEQTTLQMQDSLAA